MRYTREVSTAIEEGRPVVALESTLIAHGLPQPENVEIARMIEAAIREEGAVPATIAIVDGMVRIGLDREALDLIGGDGVAKCSARDLAVVVARRATGAHTVAPPGPPARPARPPYPPRPRSRSARASACSPPAGSAASTAGRARAGTSRPISPRSARPRSPSSARA